MSNKLYRGHGTILFVRPIAQFILSSFPSRHFRIRLHPTPLISLILFLLLSSFFLLSPSVSAAPTTMNFQGRLLDSSGNPMPDGLYNMTFALYTVSTGGTSSWNETRETTNRIQVTNGLFTTQLGEVTPLSASLFSGNSVYFEITLPTPATSTCSTAACAAWESPMTPRHKMATSAYAFNSETLDGLDSTAFGQLSTANTWTGTSLFKADSTTALQIQNAAGTTTLLTADTTNNKLVLGTATTLGITGDTRANIATIATPTDGMTTYDTTNKQLLTYSNGKWQADGKDAVIVAASNSSAADQASADYVATGTADQTVIQNALNAADPSSGTRKTGKVVLLAGTYTTSDVINIPNNTTLAGSGRGTVIQFANINGQTKNMISNVDTTTGQGVVLRDLLLDGNKATNTTGTISGVAFNGVGGGSGSTARQGAVITNIWANNFTTDGIYISNSANSSIANSTAQGNGSQGIRVGNSSRSVIANNISQGNTAFGISIAGTSFTSINANTINDNTGGGVLFSGTATDNNFTSNALRENGGSVSNSSIQIAVVTSDVDRTFIVGNSIYDSVGTGSAILISGATADDTYLSNNSFSGPGASNISDAGTNTRYVGQATAALGANVLFRQANSTTALTVQNASGTSLLTADTTNDRITIGTSDTTGTLLVLDTKTGAGDPTGVNGAMYYNSDMRKFRCYENGAWSDCIGIMRPAARRFTYLTYPGSGTTFSLVGDISTAVVAGTAVAATTSEPAALNFATTTTINNANGHSGNVNYDTDNKITYQAYAAVPTTTLTRVWLGVTNQTLATMGGSANPAGNYAAFRYDTSAGDTNFMCVTKDGTTINAVSSGVAIDTAGHEFEIRQSSTEVTFYIDGVRRCTHTTNLPSANTLLRYVNSVTTLEAVAKSLRVSFVYVESDK